MVTRDTVFRARIKVFFIFEFAILSAFSLITDDGMMNEVLVTPSYTDTKGQIENTPTSNVSALQANINNTASHRNGNRELTNPLTSDKSVKTISKIKRPQEDVPSLNATTLNSDKTVKTITKTTRDQEDIPSLNAAILKSDKIVKTITKTTWDQEDIPSLNATILKSDTTVKTITKTNQDEEVIPSLNATILKSDITVKTTTTTNRDQKEIPSLNATISLLPIGGTNWSNSKDFEKEKLLRTLKINNEPSRMSDSMPISRLLSSTSNITKIPKQTKGVKESYIMIQENGRRKIISKKHDEVKSLKNVSERVLTVKKSGRHGKEFISEETLMESRNYNYDPLYPTYNQQPLTGNPTASGEDAYQLQTFATITRDLWPNYQQQDLVTYPTLTTAKTPRAHAHPQFPGPNLNRWRFPFLSYRQAAKLRGTYHKDEVPSFYDYLEDGDASPLESMNMHRWSPPTSEPVSGSSISPIRPEFHRYHEGGGYDYSPQYDFAHVHEHAGHTESHDTGYKMDFTKIGLLLLLKLAVLKLKAFGALQILLLLLLKAKLLLAMMALKFFMILKALKLLKYLLAPMLLMSLLPLLLLGPLSLLTALLPLLMNLNPPEPDEPDEPPDIPDVPDVPDEPDMPDEGTRRRKKHSKSRGMVHVQRVLRSEDCLQRIACELAAKRQLALVPLIVSWSLQGLARILPVPSVKAYAEAYAVGRQNNKTTSRCSTKYRCSYYLRKRS